MKSQHRSPRQSPMKAVNLLVLATALATQAAFAGNGQDITDESGNTFMEETTPTPKAAPKQKIQIDYSNVGVPVDAKGNIVPIIDRSAPGGVRQNYSNLEVYSEPAWNFLPAPVFNAYGQPVNFYPPGASYGSPYSYGNPSGMPFGNQFGGMPYGASYGSPYGAPYGAFGMPFGGYNPYNTGVGINLGKNFHLNFSSSPTPYGWGMPNLNPMTNPYPTGSVFGAPPLYGGLNPSGYPYFPPRVGGFGLNLFAPSYTQWQSTSTITPLIPNLNGP